MENRRTTRGRAPKRIEEVASVTTTTIGKRTTTATAAPSVPPSIPAPTLNVRTTSPGRTRSPARTRQSPPPVRRSSRPRSSASSTTITITPVVPPSPIKETKEPKTSPKSRISLATVAAAPRGASNRLPATKTITKSFMQSSYTSNSEDTIEIRSSVTGLDTDISKLSDFIRRSVSKSLTAAANGRESTHTPTTEAESRYSRSVSRSVYDDDNYYKAEFSDTEGNGGGVGSGVGFGFGFGGDGKPAAIIEDEEEEDEQEEEEEQYKSFNTTQPLLSTSSSTALLCRKLEVPREFGGTYGALALMLLAPCLVYYLQWSCGNDACALKSPQLGAIFNVDYLTKKMFQTETVVAYLIFNVGIFVLSASLFGKRVRLHSMEYKFNALPMAVLLTLGVAVATYLKYPLADFLQRHYLRFCIYGFLNAYVVAQWCYIRTDILRPLKDNTQANVYGKSGDCIIDYALGRQLNPKWLGFVEFKQVFYRISLLSALLFAESFICKSVQLPSLPLAAGANFTINENTLSVAFVQDVWHWLQLYGLGTKYDSAALLTAGMLLLYISDAIAFEHHLASSFELQGEGFGCLLLLRYAATPYLISAVARHFQMQHVNINCKFAIYLPLLLLFVGLALKRFSNAVKYKYRINPNNPLFYGIETIHTFQGRRLLLGGLWGRMRQPNYAGDILALTALGLPLFMRFAWPPLLGLLLCVLLLLHRAVRVNVRNLSRYHSSWVRYCSQVRHYILPKIY